jgi:hypothetical protein
MDKALHPCLRGGFEDVLSTQDRALVVILPFALSGGREVDHAVDAFDRTPDRSPVTHLTELNLYRSCVSHFIREPLSVTNEQPDAAPLLQQPVRYPTADEARSAGHQGCQIIPPLV